MPTSSSSASPITLDTLSPGETGVVVGLVGKEPVDQRLLDLGLVPGTPVRALRRAPLGDPTEYELRGYRLCLRRTEGARVRVRRELRAGPADGEGSP
jgi:ferrous iron transport protein A